MSKENFAHTITQLDDRLPNVMSDCEKYGMTWGCDTGCPVLQRGDCELKDDENKELYEQCLEELDQQNNNH